MKMAILLLWLVLAVALLPGVKLSQDLANADDLSVGDRFQFNIRADVALRSAVVPDTITNFHVLKSERIDKGSDPAWLQLTLVPLLTGSHSFPSLEVIPEAPSPERLYTDRFRLNIIPVRAAQDTMLVDVKPLARYPGQLPFWLYPLLLAALALLALLWFHKTKAPTPPPQAEIKEAPPAPALPDPAWKVALRKLDELLLLDLVNQGEYIAHHYQLSLILRQFLEKKYRFAAVEMTTSEIAWVTQRIWVEQSPEVVEFLQYCDLVKFAKRLPASEDVAREEAWLRGWLQAFELIEAQHRIALGSPPHA